MQKVNLVEKLTQFSDHWQPKIVGELNGQHVKLVKISGDRSSGTSTTTRTNSSWSSKAAFAWSFGIGTSGWKRESS